MVAAHPTLSKFWSLQETVLGDDIPGCIEAGKAADVWSCAVLLYIMLFAQKPFVGETERELEQNIVMININPTPEGVADEAIMDLLNQMLVLDPMERPTTAQIREHPAFRRNLPRQILVCLLGSHIQGYLLLVTAGNDPSRCAQSGDC
jgi:serine/threonine protein kinase